MIQIEDRARHWGAGFLSLDLETCLIRPGLQAPPPVCLVAGGVSSTNREIIPSTGSDLADAARRYLESDALIVGANIAFDALVLMAWAPELEPLIWAAYDADRIIDLFALERLGEISGYCRKKPKLNMKTVGASYGIKDLDKEGPARTTFGQFLGKPLADYSEEHISYALSDATAGATIFARQVAKFGEEITRADAAELSRRALWLRSLAARGVRADPEKTQDLEIAARDKVEELQDQVADLGFIRLKKTKGVLGWSKHMKTIKDRVFEAYDKKPPMTQEQKSRTSKKPFVPQVKTDKTTLGESGDPALETFAAYGEWQAVINKDLKILTAGAKEPIHTFFGFADTTRTTSSGPNLQNVRRAAGIRECFKPRPGFCYLSADYSGLELCTLAQACSSFLGLRNMADQINAGIDLHSNVGAQILGVSYDVFRGLFKALDEAAVQARQTGKVVNFGRPGGLGAATLTIYAKSNYGVVLTINQALALISAWERANPDGLAYLQWIGALPQNQNGYCVPLPGSNIVRRGATFCSAANTPFQSLGARVAGAAGFEIMRACRSGRGPLKDSRPLFFIHDEFILETPIDRIHEAGEELSRIMVSAPRSLMPDVRLEAEALAADRWSKKAQRITDENGTLKIWRCAA